MTQDSPPLQARDILEALDRSFEQERSLEQREDDEKAARYEATLTRLKDADPPTAEEQSGSA